MRRSKCREEGLPDDDAAATEAMLEAKQFGYGSRFDLDSDAASPTTGVNRATCIRPRDSAPFSWLRSVQGCDSYAQAR